MADRLPRLCGGRCGAIGVFPRGRCASCLSTIEKRRGSATKRGYGAWWAAFRLTFVGMLVALGIAPICGATLPDGPRTKDSDCQAEGLFTFASDDGTDLHLDHEPPLEDHERRDRDAVCNPRRIQLLCRRCHSRKTLRERLGETRG